MRTSNIDQYLSCICLALLFVSSASHAGIFKWVDSNGQTHYSESKAEADKAKAAELKVRPAPPSTQAADPLMRSMQEQQRQEKISRDQSMTRNTSQPPEKKKPVSLSGGRVDETSDKSRCNLARDIISGAVRHGNGAAIDSYDREIAKNDIRMFCH